MPNNQRKKMNEKSIMGLDFSKFGDSNEEEIPELVRNENEYENENENEEFIEEKPIRRARKSTGNGRKSKRFVKNGRKGTRKQVRFSA